MKLPKRLENLAALLEKHEEDLEGLAWNKVVTAFDKALTKFEEQTQEAAKGLAPGMRDFLKFVENPSSKALLKEPYIGKWFREVTGKRAGSGAKANDLKKGIISYVKENGSPKNALAAGVKILAEATSPTSPVPKEREQLLLELQRLGGLSDDLLEYELKTRYKALADIKALAKVVNITVKERKKEAILSDIISTARRQYGHQISL